MATFDVIAGYTPVSDVVAHSLLDLDMAEIQSNSELLTDAGLADAWTAYAVGGNSLTTDSTRTIRGLSLEAQEKMTGEKWFDVYEDYWAAPDYADLFTTAACNGTGDFSGATELIRAKGCLMGAQYQNLWMHVIHELEDAITDCNAGDLNANDGGPHAWDQAWAFYAGSSEGIDGSGSGYMLYDLSTRMCELFATCSAGSDGSTITGTSQVDVSMLELYQEGQEHLLDGDCGDAENTKDEIIDLMTVPLLQGLLWYLSLADPETGIGGDFEAAQLWPFSAAILPRIHECDPDVAATIRANTDITSSDAPVSEGYVFLKEKLESAYSCMGVSCSQVGGLWVTGSTTFMGGFEPCSDSDSGFSGGSGGSGGGGDDMVLLGFAAGSAALVIGIGALGCFLCMRRRRSDRRETEERGREKVPPGEQGQSRTAEEEGEEKVPGEEEQGRTAEEKGEEKVRDEEGQGRTAEKKDEEKVPGEEEQGRTAEEKGEEKVPGEEEQSRTAVEEIGQETVPGREGQSHTAEEKGEEKVHGEGHNRTAEESGQEKVPGEEEQSHTVEEKGEEKVPDKEEQSRTAADNGQEKAPGEEGKGSLLSGESKPKAEGEINRRASRRRKKRRRRMTAHEHTSIVAFASDGVVSLDLRFRAGRWPDLPRKALPTAPAPSNPVGQGQGDRAHPLRGETFR